MEKKEGEAALRHASRSGMHGRPGKARVYRARSKRAIVMIDEHQHVPCFPVVSRSSWCARMARSGIEHPCTRWFAFYARVWLIVNTAFMGWSKKIFLTRVRSRGR